MTCRLAVAAIACVALVAAAHARNNVRIHGTITAVDAATLIVQAKVVGTGTRAGLQVGEYVFASAQAQADSGLAALRVQVGKDGVRPAQ